MPRAVIIVQKIRYINSEKIRFNTDLLLYTSETFDPSWKMAHQLIFDGSYDYVQINRYPALDSGLGSITFEARIITDTTQKGIYLMSVKQGNRSENYRIHKMTRRSLTDHFMQNKKRTSNNLTPHLKIWSTLAINKRKKH